MTTHLLGHLPQPSASRAGNVQRDLALQASPECKLLEQMASWGEHTLKIMNIVPPLNIQKKDIRLKSMTLKGNLMIMSYMLST